MVTALWLLQKWKKLLHKCNGRWRRARICERNATNAKVREERGAGGAPGAGADSPLVCGEDHNVADCTSIAHGS